MLVLNVLVLSKHHLLLFLQIKLLLCTHFISLVVEIATKFPLMMVSLIYFRQAVHEYLMRNDTMLGDFHMNIF